jgi:hypothetical protein
MSYIVTLGPHSSSHDHAKSLKRHSGSPQQGLTDYGLHVHKVVLKKIDHFSKKKFIGMVDFFNGPFFYGVFYLQHPITSRVVVKILVD